MARRSKDKRRQDSLAMVLTARRKGSPPAAKQTLTAADPTPWFDAQQDFIASLSLEAVRLYEDFLVAWGNLEEEGRLYQADVDRSRADPPETSSEPR